jgi:hypothetical protein
LIDVIVVMKEPSLAFLGISSSLMISVELAQRSLSHRFFESEIFHIILQDCCSRYWIVANEGNLLPVHQQVLQGSEANGLTPKEYFKKIYGLAVLQSHPPIYQIDNFHSDRIHSANSPKSHCVFSSLFN